jgi:hypothetical protein
MKGLASAGWCCAISKWSVRVHRPVQVDSSSASWLVGGVKRRKGPSEGDTQGAWVRVQAVPLAQSSSARMDRRGSMVGILSAWVVLWTVRS